MSYSPSMTVAEYKNIGVSCTKKPKYNNEKTIIDGIEFMSRKESRYYCQLKMLERAGKIRDLKLQPQFPIVVNGIKICKVISDFSYFEGDRLIVIDVKGFWTKSSRIKWKLAQACYPHHAWRLIK